MIVKRVSNLDIHSRSFITAIKGNIDDSFVDEDLCSYTFDQQLYLYLKNEGYERIYFYTRASGYNWYTFDKNSLDPLFSKKTNNSTDDGRPLGRGLLKKASNIDDNSNLIKEGRINNRPYYYVSNFQDSTLVKTVQDILKNSKNKSVVYFTSPVFELEEKQGFIAGIEQIMREVAATQSDNKLLLPLNSNGVFNSDFFTELFKSPENVFTVGLPDATECKNWLNANRIKGNINGKHAFDFPFDKLQKQIFNQHKRINSLDKELKQNGNMFIDSLNVEDFSEELLSRSLTRIHGQQDNMEVIIKKVVTWINRPDEAKKPLVFMFAGTSGTGKTYTAETITECLASYGFIFLKLPMNEYKGEGDKSKLLGSPTGYVGSEEDAPIFAARRKSEKLVVLFDEMDKAHESIFEIIMTLMEKGELTNGKGERFDFKQCIIIFTTNLAMENLIKKKKELLKSGLKIDSYEFQDPIKQILKNNGIKNEVCGRINSVFVYNTLGKEVVLRIAIEETRKLGKIYNLEINNISPVVLQRIVSQMEDNNEGARPIVNSVADCLETVFSNYFISRTDAKKDGNDNTPIFLVDINDSFEIVESKTNHLLSVGDIIEQNNDISKTKKTISFNKEQLKTALKAVKGQQDNVDLIVETTNTWLRKAKKNKPLVFMLAGTSGTGKTYTVETISNALKDYKMVKLNMNEYQSEGDIWKLLGSPRGYAGSEEDSPIFAARRESGKLVILFDEIEKADASLFTTIMTLMEKGEMSDGHGETFDFKQSIIFFTTNLAMKELVKLKKESIRHHINISSQEFQDAAKGILKAAKLKEEVSGRIDWLLVYNTLDASVVAQIAWEKVRSLGLEYEININQVPQSLLAEVSSQCKESDEGARPINRVVTNRLESVFQEVYESDTFNPNLLYDINEQFNIIPSSSDSIIPVESLTFGLDEEEEDPETAKGPVTIKLSSNPFFEDGYNYDNYRKATGLIKLDNGNKGTGSGFLISQDGYILTCAHCTDANKISFVKDDDKKEFEANVIYKNDLIDIAILKIDANDMPYLSISDSVRPLKVGAEIVIMAYPSGTDISDNISAFEGKVSNFNNANKTYITDAVAAPGSSGGALVAKKDGKVYGVLQGGYKETLDVDINASFDIRNLFKQNDLVIEFN